MEKGTGRWWTDRKRDRKYFHQKIKIAFQPFFKKSSKVFCFVFQSRFPFYIFCFCFCSFCFCFSSKVAGVRYIHRHLRYIDCLTAHTACLVCFSNSVSSRSKRKRKRSLITIKTGASCGHITNLKQSMLLRCLWVFRDKIKTTEPMQ